MARRCRLPRIAAYGILEPHHLRAALICLPHAGAEQVLAIGGRTIAVCQLELALRGGCGLIAVYGNGASRDVIDLRHRAERSGARFQTISTAQALIGLIGEQDDLLVLQPGLWPDCAAAEEDLRGGKMILVLPAGPGRTAGFERIDLDRAWAGALVLPGSLLQQLGALPEDIAPAPALLRIALQNRLPETRLPATLIDEGRWNVLRSLAQAKSHQQQWLRRIVGEARGSAMSRRLAVLCLHRSGDLLASEPRAMPGLLGALVAVLLAAGVTAWQGYEIAAFAVLALAAPLVEVVTGTARLRASPADPGRGWRLLALVGDAALGFCAVMAIGGLWYRALFAPVVMVAALALLDKRPLPDNAGFVRDRGIISLICAMLCAILPPELAIALVAGALLLANFARPAQEIG